MLSSPSVAAPTAGGPAPAVASVDALAAALITGSMDAIVTQSPAGIIVGWNPAAERLYRRSSAEVIGQPFTSLVCSESLEGHAAVVARVVGGERVAHHTSRHIADDGRVIDVSIALSAIPDATGEVVGIAAICRDISLYTRIETQLARSRAALERRATELERSNDELEQFAYVVSHDLSEPLRAMSSFVQLLSKDYTGRLDSDADRYMMRISDGATRMRTLIDDLLAFSRVGRTQPAREPIDTAELVAQVVESLDASLAEAGGVVEIGELPVVFGDRSHLRQLFQNLVANAIKFRAEAPLRIRVEGEQGQGNWSFAVADNGIGIQPHQAHRIFLVFKRLHGQRAYPGNGIGLAICKKVVEAHDGRIWVEPGADGGSIFHFTIGEPSEENG